MKLKIVSIITVMCLLYNLQAEAQGFWKKLGKAIGNVTEAAVVVAVDRTVEKYAPEQAAQYRQTMQQLNEQSQRRAEEDKKAWDEYSQYRKEELQKELGRTSNYEAREMIRQEMADLNGISANEATNHNTSLTGSILSGVGINQQNIQKGMAWNAAQNKYERQNVAKDFVFDAAGNISENAELIEKFRQISEAQNIYLSEKSKAMTVEEKQTALSNRNRAYAEIGFQTYIEAEERNSQHLAAKLQISQKLMKSGWYNDSQLANEVAGSIIAIQKSNLSEQEKEALFNAYGFGNAKQVSQAVNEVLTSNTTTNSDVERIKAEEAKRQAELERKQAEQKAAEERRNAIQKVETIKINGYSFDKTALSQNQKLQLDEIADILSKYSDIKVLVVGHTCNIGYKSINQKKGLKRADVAKEYLVNKGISQDRISVDSKGEIQPLEKNDSESNRKLNRRVEIIVE